MPKPSGGISAPAKYIPHVAKGAFINFSGIIIRLILVYVYTFALAKLLPVDDLGTYFLMFTVINLLGLAAMVGLDLGVVRYVSLYAGEERFDLARRTLRFGLAFAAPAAAFFTVLLIVAAPQVSEHLLGGSAGSITSLRVFALAVPLMVAARLFNATTQGMHRMQYQVYSRDAGEQVFKLLLSLAALGLGMGLLGVVWANVAAVGVAAILSLYYAWLVLLRISRDKPAPKPAAVPGQDRPGLALWRYSYPLALANILVAVLLQIDTLLLGSLGTTSDVGYYGVAMKLAVLSSKIILAFGTVMTPIIADLWNRKETQELQTLFRVISRWIVVLSLPLFLVLVFFSNGVMRIFGAGFTAGSLALVLLACGQMINAATGLSGMMILMSGMSKLELLNIVVTLVIDIALCYTLIPPYGLVGAAIANMVSIGAVNIMRLFEVWRFMKMQPYDMSYAKPLVAGAAGVAVSALAGYLALGTGSPVRVGILAVLLLAVYVGAMAAMGFDQHDRALFRMVKERLRPA